MKRYNGVACSIAKLDEGLVSEDAVRGEADMIAVSDGAGGGGVYAERWSAYLLEKLPTSPICSYEELDGWIEGIWEPFYNSCEEDAKMVGGMLLDKFYDEGSFATLAAAWRTSPTSCRWMSYGDSVVFHYNSDSDTLEHSFTRLDDFSKPPYLLNCKDESSADGFRSGEFELDAKSSTVFVATDALAHYLMMMYQLAHREDFEQELQLVLQGHTKQRHLVQQAMAQSGKIYFKDKVLGKMINASKLRHNFSRHLSKLKREGILGHDDYSFAAM